MSRTAKAMRRKNVPYSAPLDPPTLLTRVMPTCLSNAAGASAALVSMTSTTAEKPRYRFRAVVGISTHRIEFIQRFLVQCNKAGAFADPLVQCFSTNFVAHD